MSTRRSISMRCFSASHNGAIVGLAYSGREERKGRRLHFALLLSAPLAKSRYGPYNPGRSRLASGASTAIIRKADSTPIVARAAQHGYTPAIDPPQRSLT